MYCVYKHTVPNGKVYTGITSVNPLKRWSNGHGYKDNKHFWKDIVLYGWLNIKHEILYDGLTELEARDTEARLIYKYQSYRKKYGYNKEVGYVYSYVEKPEYKDARTKMCREEYLAYCASDEYRQRCRPKTNKQIDVFDKYNYLVASYDSIRETARKLNVDKKNITDCLRGKQKTCKGYTFKVRPRVDTGAV